MGDYKEPIWAQRPQHAWKLVEIKSGIEIAHHSLEKACLLLGRAADMVDLELAHESCSRQHARIAFDSRGFPWLRDLSSTHGTLVNKKQLPSQTIGDTESMSKEKGSRGVILFPGDILQFGCSTRLYCLEGPSNFERGVVKALEQQQKLLEDRQTTNRNKPQMHREEEVQKVLDESSIPPQFQKLWEALKAKQYKQQNIETENQRIVAKVELSTGQETQLERNRQKLSSLKDVITQMELDLQSKIYPEEKINRKRLFAAAIEDEDVEDRTQDRSTLQKAPETEESLIAKWKTHHKRWIEQEEAEGKIEERLERLGEKIAVVNNEEDRFFLQNEVDLNQDTMNKIKRDQTALLRAIKDTEQLLSVVNKKIMTDLKANYMTMDSLHPIYSSNDAPLSSANGSTPQFLSSEPKKDLPPVPAFSKDKMENFPPVAVFGKETMVVKTLAPISSNETILDERLAPMPIMEAVKDKTLVTKRWPIHGPSTTLSKLKANDTIATSAFMSKFETNALPKNNSKIPSSICDIQKDEWQKPVGQDGSGRTKLNKKFEGRY